MKTIQIQTTITEAAEFCTKAVEQLMNKIQGGRSQYRNDEPNSFLWYYTFDLEPFLAAQDPKEGPDGTNYRRRIRECLRLGKPQLVAKKGRSRWDSIVEIETPRCLKRAVIQNELELANWYRWSPAGAALDYPGTPDEELVRKFEKMELPALRLMRNENPPRLKWFPVWIAPWELQRVLIRRVDGREVVLRFSDQAPGSAPNFGAALYKKLAEATPENQADIIIAAIEKYKREY